MRSTAAPARAAALSWSNWAGNQRGDAASGLRPSTVDEIVAAVRAAGPSTNIGRPTVVPGELEFAGRPSSKR